MVLGLACMSSVAHTVEATAPEVKATLPCQPFTHAPQKPHDPAARIFTFDQLGHWYRMPGEFTHRLDGDQYGFEALSFIISETHPGGGPGLHVHDTEEAHILLKGTVRYQIGTEAFTAEAPYVAKVPAGVPHTFINAGTEPFNLIAVFSTKHPTTTRGRAQPAGRGLAKAARGTPLRCGEVTRERQRQAELRPGATMGFGGFATGGAPRPGVNFQPAGGPPSSFARIGALAQLAAYETVTSAPLVPASAKQSMPNLILSGRTIASCTMSGRLPSGNCNWKRPVAASG